MTASDLGRSSAPVSVEEVSGAQPTDVVDRTQVAARAHPLNVTTTADPGLALGPAVGRGLRDLA